MSEESRKFIRTPFNDKGFFELDDLAREFDLLNISLKGALLKIHDDNPFKIADKGIFKLHLSNSEVKIVVESVVAHIEGDHLGIKFISIDPDSMIHLRRLLELNTIPEGVIEKELFFLGKD